jgi:hypothetical protein
MGAPLGFKTFTTGDVLTAADTNGYLMQGVWTFASAAARDAAVTSPQEGNTCYLKDTDVIQCYSGSAWVTKSASSTGGWTSLTSGTLSGATTTTSTFSTAYVDLRVVITNFLPATDNGELNMRFNADSGANRHLGFSNSPQLSTAFSQTSVIMATGNDNSVANGLIIIDIPSYSNTTTWKIANSRNITVDATTTTSFNIQNRIGAYNQTAAISSLSFIPSTGNFTSGNYTVYGA